MSHLDPLSSTSSSCISSWFIIPMQNAAAATLSFLLTKYFSHLQLFETDREKRVRFKKMPLIENETPEKEADSYLKNGDLAIGRGSYAEASKYYRQASALYDKLNSQELISVHLQDKKPVAAETPVEKLQLRDDKYEDANTKYNNALVEAKQCKEIRCTAKKAMEQFKFTYGMHLYNKAQDSAQNDLESGLFYYEEAFNRLKDFNCLERELAKAVLATKGCD